MAFANKFGNLLKNAINSKPSLFQSIRCMSSSKLFIGGISYGTDDYSLKEAFSSYGEVVEAKIIMDRETGRSRGFGFVTFASSEEASSALSAMDGKELHGRNIRVNYATERTGGGGGGYGGGGYGGGGYGGSYGGGGYGSSGGGYGSRGGGGYSGGGSNYGDSFGSASASVGDGNYAGSYGDAKDDGSYAGNYGDAKDDHEPNDYASKQN